MAWNRVTLLQFTLLLVSIVFSTISNAYIHHEDKYYDQEQYNSNENNIEDHHEPNYSYQYQVNSPHTGDYKTQQEERIGDTVRGSYSLIEPDGTRRIVEYTADALHGFKAVVKREPPTTHLHQVPEIVEPKPITKPPTYPRPTPIRLPKPTVMKYPPKLFYLPQSAYHQTSLIKPRSPPKKYSFFRFNGWPFRF